MPFRSQAQWRWAFATDQEFAEEWARLTPGGKRRFELLRKRVAKKASVTDNPTLWKKAITQAKRKFDVYPSAYANAWAARWYKKRGGTWSTSKEISHKHLPGKHDQRKHGRDGGGGSGISSGSGTANQEAIAEYHKTVQPIIDDSYRLNPQEARLASAKIISNMDEATQMALLDDPKINGITFTSLAVFGTPLVRDTAARRYQEITQGKMYYGNETEGEPFATYNALGERIDSPYQFMHRHSLEFAEYRIGQGQDTANFLWGMHAGFETGFATAQLQMAISQVGPNRDVPRNEVRSFYPDGITPPEPQQRYVTAFQQTYDKTQTELAERGITEITLHRGSKYKPGIALEPWTPQKSVSNEFAKHYNKTREYNEPKVVVRSAKIPARYILATWQTAEGWDEESVRGKKEHMVAGLAYAYDTGEIR